MRPTRWPWPCARARVCGLKNNLLLFYKFQATGKVPIKGYRPNKTSATPEPSLPGSQAAIIASQSFEYSFISRGRPEIIITIIFLLIFAAYWNIQIVNNEYFRRLAMQNITRSIDLTAPRGLIVDSKRVILSENKINFTLYLVRENVTNMEKTLRLASFFAAKKTDTISRIIARYKKDPQFYRIPIKNNLGRGTVIFIESRQEEFPEFEIGVEPTRTYPLENCAANVLGYMSEITETELSSKEWPGYGLGDFIGRSGIEKQYEFFLKGTKGSQTVIKNNVERIQQISGETKPAIGDTVVLTLDLPLQEGGFLGTAFGAHPPKLDFDSA